MCVELSALNLWHGRNLSEAFLLLRYFRKQNKLKIGGNCKLLINRKLFYCNKGRAYIYLHIYHLKNEN